MLKFAKGLLCVAVVGTALASVTETAQAQPQGFFITVPGFGGGMTHIHSSRFDPWSNIAVPGTQSQFVNPFTGHVHQQYIGMDGRPHSNIQDQFGNMHMIRKKTPRYR